MVHLARLVVQVLLGLKDQLGNLEHLGLSEIEEPLVQLETLEMLEIKDFQDNPDSLVHRVPLGLQELLVKLEPQAFLDLRVSLDQ